MTVASALADLVKRPVDLLVKRWNWKAAVTSSVIRGLIFFTANITSGWRAAFGAMLAEYFYRALTSGFYGAITQHISGAEPAWEAAACAMVILPLSSHSLEFLVHWLRHTPHLKASIISSMSFTVISTLFNFYVMRRGTMVVGENAASLGSDLRAMPRMIARFVSAGPLWGLARYPVKTLHLTNAWHATSGGVGTFYKALFDAANREGHWMRLIVPGPETRIEKVGQFGMIYYLQAGLAPLDHSYRMLLPHRYLFPNTAIQRIINHERPDLIEIAEKYTLLYLGGLVRTSRLPGVRTRPVVVGASHERMDENVAAYVSRNEAARRFCRWYMKWLYFPMFDHHITFSEHTAEELIEASHGHKVRRGIWVTPMGVDCELFNLPRRTENGGITRLLYAGRLSPEKNVLLLVDMMARLDPREFRLSIAGDGPLRGAMQSRPLPHVAYLGHIADRAELAAVYAGADIFVHPNPNEPFGIAPLEAMAAGLALIAPDSGGVASYANSANAWLVRAEAGPMADCAREIRASPALTAAKTEAARQTAREFDWTVVTSRFLKLYEELTVITKNSHLQSALYRDAGLQEQNTAKMFEIVIVL